MKKSLRSLCAISAAAACIALSAPAAADIARGNAAWEAGDYKRAVAEWADDLAAGDPAAQYNMAQAYRLGRGVQADEAMAEALYAKAAAQGHIKAADNYGLLLFQSGRREQALPFVTDSAERGDPRAQYLLGIAHFNGDLLPKDWVRAYALMTLSNAAGFPQAVPAIKQMDDYIPLDQRQQAASLAGQLRQQSDATRARQLAAVDLSVEAEPAAAAAAPVRSVPRPMASVDLSPSAAAPVVVDAVPPAARAASIATVQQANRSASIAAGTANPADAGADYVPRPVGHPVPAPIASTSVPPSTVAPVPAPVPVPVAVAPPARASAPQPVARPEAPAPSGPWKLQLGAFSQSGGAERLWSRVSTLAPLRGRDRIVENAGNITRLKAGGWASRAAAEQACAALKAAGQDCLVTR